MVWFVLGGAVLAVVFFVLLGFRYIPNNRVAIVERRFSSKGSVTSGLIALNGEAGYLPRLLRGGIHWLMPFQYSVHRMPLVTIPQGRIGYVFARDGISLGPDQALASNIKAKGFEDVEAFLRLGGQRGPQRMILREGVYAINLAQFVVVTENAVYYMALNRTDEVLFRDMARVIQERQGFTPVVIKGTDDNVGVVTVHDGPALPEGQIIAPVVGELGATHNPFQDAEAFLAAGGRRGRQYQVLVEGTYYVNRLFATVEFIEKTVVDVGFVGVVVSYVGDAGKDLSGEAYTHGELVAKGLKGVWSEPLLPGKYAFNTYAGRVVIVPTTNFMLKWIKSEVGEHAFDSNLSEVGLITRDAFEPSLPLSVVVHIDYRKAPLVVQRFGDIRRLVEQTLDPMVAAYFKNVGQTRTLIELLQGRSEIQKQSSTEMREKFSYYNLQLEEVLIGTPKSPQGSGKLEQILEQLRARQIAEEQIETYNKQEKAANKERALREAEATAQQQTKLTESEIAITVQSNQGKADYQRSLQQAAQVKAMAEAEASKVRSLAAAEAERAAKIGVAQAIAVEEQVRAYGGPVYQLTQSVLARFAQAIEQSKVDVVPKIVIGGQDGKGTGNVMESLLALMMSEKMLQSGLTSNTPQRPEVTAIRDQILKSSPPHS